MAVNQQIAPAGEAGAWSIPEQNGKDYNSTSGRRRAIREAAQIVAGWKWARLLTVVGGGGRLTARELRRALRKAEKFKLPREVRHGKR
ncbi:MAG: hypothetical protein N3C63_07445 [Rhodocyclaceae bacterium]|nr:hypothetical protein [Rhodocyclaceae bacterium]